MDMNRVFRKFKRDFSKFEPYLEDFEKFMHITQGYFGDSKVKYAAMHTRIAEFLQSPSKRKLLLTFRSSRKSTISQQYLLWRILNNINISTIRASSTKTLADSQITKIRQIIECNPLWDCLVNKQEWRNDYFTVNGRYSKSTGLDYLSPDPTAFSASIGTNIVGRHCNLIIVDDLVDDKNSCTTDQREKCLQWLRALESIAQTEEDGEIIIIGTRWHKDDVYSELIKSGEYDVLIIPAIIDGKPTWPEAFPLEKLDSIKGRQGNIMFAMQYLLDANPEELATLKQLPFLDRTAVPKGQDLVFMDWSWGLGKDAAPAILTRYIDNKLYILDYIYARNFVPEAHLYRVQTMANGCKIYMDGSHSGIINQMICQEARRNVITLPNPTSKEVRIAQIKNPWNSGRIVLSSMCQELVDEVYDYNLCCSPKGKGFSAMEHDDFLDTIAYAVNFYKMNK